MSTHVPSNANSLVGKRDVWKGLRVFDAQGPGRRGKRYALEELVLEFSCEEDGARCMARDGRRQRVVEEREGTFQTEGREYRTGLVYEAPSLSLNAPDKLPWVFLLTDIWSPQLYC